MSDFITPPMDELPQIFLARHGETAWSLTGQHTGLTDLPLTHCGEINAARLAERLQGQSFDRVYVSPLKRARQTCQLAGFGESAQVDADLVEWNYGAYEGQTTAEIRRTRPGWQLFRDGCPQGESLEGVVDRAQRVLERWKAGRGNTLVFSSGHFLRVLTTQWLGLPIAAGALLHLDTATLSSLGYDHSLKEPVVRLWNDGRHVLP